MFDRVVCADATPTDTLPTQTAPDGAVLDLLDPRAAEIALTGAKAANLARASGAGLPVLRGFVITTVATARLELADEPDQADPVHRMWAQLSEHGVRPLAVRSSSVAEDAATSSMAGRFDSVLHVSGWAAFVDAVARVLASAYAPGLTEAPMAVLVQPMAQARLGGVLFGVDPLTGDRDRYLASVVDGLPDQIVSGAVTGTTVTLGRRGRLRSASGPLPPQLRGRERRALARLARSTARAFGSAQDMEWLIEPSGALRLLQSRPVTASAVPAHGGRLFGPGPVAESFPDPLAPLEHDLWARPLEQGVREAMRLSGAASRRAIEGPFIVNVGGRIAVDLEAIGVAAPRRSRLRILDPRPPMRRLRAAWRMGRLRVAMPAIVADLADEVDALLAAVPAVESLGDRELLTVLDNSTQTLVGLHAHEVLAGFFLDGDVSATTGASLGLATLAKARFEGLRDADIITRYPVTLTLLAPRVGSEHRLPDTPIGAHLPTGVDDHPSALARETMRLRVRWVQELGSRAAAELGRRLAARGQLRVAGDVRGLGYPQLAQLVDAMDVALVVRSERDEQPPLPARFRLAVDGTVVPDLSVSSRLAGVSPGRASGAVTHDRTDASGAVLVATSLDPGLSGVLPDLAALVTATGSPLSHLAILAREYRVPVVVGYTDELADGQLVLVDGRAGTVEEVR